MQVLSPNQEKVVFETIDDEVIIINLETGTYYSITGSGVLLWKHIETGNSREQLIGAATAYFSGDEESIVQGVNAFVDELLTEEIIAIGKPAKVVAEANGVAAGEVRPFSAPTLAIHTNMSDLLLLDPIHDVDEQGWPSQRPD